MDKKLLTQYAVFLEDPDNPDYDGSRPTEKEIKEIEQHLKKNDASRRELQAMRTEFRTMVDTFEREGFEGVSTHPKRMEDRKRLTHFRGWRTGKSVFALAAAFVLTITSTYYLMNQTQSDTTLYEKYFDIYPNLIPLSRGGESNLQHAMVEYEQGNYSATLEMLHGILDTEPNNIAAHFYSGIVNLVKGNPETAIVHFQETIAGENSKFHKHAQWYLGLAYMKSGAIASAKHNFELIVAKDVEYQQQSQEILDSLSEFSSIKSP